MAVADLSASETRKIDVADLVEKAVSSLIPDAVIPGAKLVSNSVTATQIAANAVGASELANDAVDTAAIADAAVTGAKIAADTITAANIAADAVGASELANNAVNTAAIVDLAVTNAKLAGSITADKLAGSITYAQLSLADGDIPGAKLTAASVTATQLATNSVTATQIAADAVGASELANDAVDTAAIVNLAVTTGKLADGAVTTAKLAADSVGAAALANDAVDTAAIADAAVTGAKIAADTITAANIAADAVTASELANDAVDTAAIADLAVTGAKIAADTITAANIAADAVGADELADDAVNTASIVNLAVTTGKLATGAVTTAKLAADAVDAAALANDAVDTAAIVDAAVTNAKLAGGISADKLAGSITYAQLSITDGAIPGAKLTTNSVTSTQLAADSVTASELANDSVDTAAIVNSAVTDTKLASGISGSKITTGSLDGDALATGTVDANKLDTATVGDGLEIAGGILGHTNTVTAGTRNGITFDAQGHITSTTALLASDLPLATISEVGGVSVPSSSELSVSGTGELTHTDTITPSTISGITYNSAGHITAVTALVGADLPDATDSVKGAVSVPGDALSVAAGVLTHIASGVAAGTYSKVTVDSRGHVTVGEQLAAADVPNLDASKITTGTFSSAFLAENSVTAQQLADYGIAQVSESQPTPEFAGQWWINPTDRSAYIWVGTVSPTVNGYWLLVGYGSPTQLNLRFGGTYNASTNTVVTLNQYGTEAGLTVGQALGAPNSANNGVYLAVTTAGTGTTPAPAVSLAVGDWVLSQGTGANWTKVAVVSGASGTFNDYDILCDGTYFTPDMTAVADVRDALELLWGRVQIATTSQQGVVRESAEVLVDNSTGEMTIGIVDDGTY